MKFQITLICIFLSAVLIGCSLAADNSTEETVETTSEGGRNETPKTSSMPTSTTPEPNRTIPIIVLVEEDNNLEIKEDSNTDYAARDLKWLIVRKITNISRVEEVSTDSKTGATKRVLNEDRAEEFSVFKDDQHRQVLDEKDVKSIPFPLRFML